LEKLNPLYFCLECKTVVNNANSLLFVEDQTSKGFCKESCIENFYSPIVKFFDSFEGQKRAQLKLASENLEHYLEEVSVINKSLYNPDEIWRLKNSFGESIYCQIKKHDNFYTVVVCLSYHFRPSFIINTVVTKSKKMVQFYQGGERQSISVSTINPHLYGYLNTKNLTASTLCFLEKKKNSLLGILLHMKATDDFSIDNYSVYEVNIKETLERPDEVYKISDSEGDTIYSYIKAYSNGENKGNYFYFVLCVDVAPEDDKGMETVHPFMSFPSNSREVYKTFKNGECIVGNFKN